MLCHFPYWVLVEKDVFMPPASNEENASSNPAAYLIVNSEVFPLGKELTNIGRKLDNHIVIQDPRVSRNHAQIRIVDDQYILLDLNSTGGTTVNGNKISKSVLYSGDSISLAGVNLKFVQDTPRMISKSMDRTGPLKKIKVEETPTLYKSRKAKSKIYPFYDQLACSSARLDAKHRGTENHQLPPPVDGFPLFKWNYILEPISSEAFKNNG
jgi:pSer/pThr/pTyr-binding forkhead associated (FHA) protein